MMKRVSIILLILGLIGLFGLAGLFLSDGLFIIFFIILLFVAISLIWELCSLKIRMIFGNNKKKFIKIVLICLILFFFGGITINYYWLPGMFAPISLLADTGILILTVFLGWGLTKPGKRRVLFVSAIIAILLASLFIISISRTYQYSEPSSAERIRSLGYITWVPAKDIEKVGVTKYEAGLAYEGLNIYCSEDSQLAYLMNLSGKIVHKWFNKKAGWLHAEICPNGDLLAISPDRSLDRLDFNSNIKWTKRMRFHHDLDIADNKDIYALTSRSDITFYSGLPVFFTHDYVTILSPDGKIKGSLSLFELLKEEIPPKKFKGHARSTSEWKAILQTIPHKLILVDTPYSAHYAYNDILHTNSVEIIDRDLEGICQKGDLLICAAYINLIGIMDIKKEKLIWKWGANDLERPHHPTLLENGNFLIFDNGYHRGYSRIIELNPVTKKVIWEYKANPPEHFFSQTRGSSQRLPNGNTLITESGKGRVFEITTEGEIVWEFYSPQIKKQDKKRMAIYRMLRIP